MYHPLGPKLGPLVRRDLSTTKWTVSWFNAMKTSSIHLPHTLLEFVEWIFLDNACFHYHSSWICNEIEHSHGFRWRYERMSMPFPNSPTWNMFFLHKINIHPHLSWWHHHFKSKNWTPSHSVWWTPNVAIRPRSFEQAPRKLAYNFR